MNYIESLPTEEEKAPINFGKTIIPKVTRIEVINHTGKGKPGRVYINREVEECILSYQDGGKTLKIFIK